MQKKFPSPLHGLSLKKNPIKNHKTFILGWFINPDQIQLCSTKPNNFFPSKKEKNKKTYMRVEVPSMTMTDGQDKSVCESIFLQKFISIFQLAFSILYSHFSKYNMSKHYM